MRTLRSIATCVWILIVMGIMMLMMETVLLGLEASYRANVQILVAVDQRVNVLAKQPAKEVLLTRHLVVDGGLVTNLVANIVGKSVVVTTSSVVVMLKVHVVMMNSFQTPHFVVQHMTVIHHMAVQIGV